MIYDSITYNGEADLLEIRLTILNDFVDGFVIVEFDKTFTGNFKKMHFWEDQERFKKWEDKIHYFAVPESTYNKYTKLAESSPNTKGADHWKREFCQKESIKDCLEMMKLKDDDIVFIGDCDEIWDTKNIDFYKEVVFPEKIKLRVYSYWLNNRSDEDFWGTIFAPYEKIKNVCLNDLRNNAPKTGGEHGWHFTSMGGVDEVRRKLNDSYTTEDYNTKEVQDKLKERIGKSDYIGRSFTFKVDESDLPQYLKDNKDKYAHLFSNRNV